MQEDFSHKGEPENHPYLSLNNFLNEIRDFLPQKMKKEMAQEYGMIKVIFNEKLKKDGLRLKLPLCSGDSPKGEPIQVTYAYVLHHKKGELRPEVHLHPGFRKIIGRGEEKAQTYSCGHKNMYRLALATVLHELTHLWDLSYKRPLSSRPSFRHLTGWKKSFWSGWVQKNQKKKSSPDHYEFENPKESLAVNMEFFLLDPYFACYRPAVYQVFQKEFDHIPFDKLPCDINYLAFLNNEPEQVSLDPSRIWDVHYFLAGEGNSVINNFGHSMLRLIVCAPSRELGPGCLYDEDYHIVISFRANVTDESINHLKGMFGGYESMPFLYSLKKVIDEYGQGEKRDVYSLPFNWSTFFYDDEEKKREAIKLLVHQTLESVWGYRGLYYFLTNNCATETQDLLRPGILPVLGIDPPDKIAPTWVWQEFLKLGVLDRSLLETPGKAKRLGLMYSSEDSRLKKAYTILKQASSTKLPKDVTAFLEKFEGKKRRNFYQKLLPKDQGLSRELRAVRGAATLVENEALRRERKRIGEEITKVIKKSNLQNMDEHLKEFHQKGLLLLPDRLTQDMDHYGVPLAHELISLEDYQRRWEEKDQAMAKVYLWARSNKPEEFTRVIQIEETRSWLESL